MFRLVCRDRTASKIDTRRAGTREPVIDSTREPVLGACLPDETMLRRKPTRLELKPDDMKE